MANNTLDNDFFGGFFTTCFASCCTLSQEIKLAREAQVTLRFELAYTL
jgi:hypothetical protein